MDQLNHLKSLGICAVILAAVPFSGCLASQPEGPRVVSENSSERLEDLTVGDSLWMVRVVEQEKLYSTGQVTKSSQSNLYLCTKDADVGAACRLAHFPPSGSGRRRPVTVREHSGETDVASPSTTLPSHPGSRAQELCRKYIAFLDDASMAATRTAAFDCFKHASGPDGDAFLTCLERASNKADGAACQTR